MNCWIYDESAHCGVDYSKTEQADVYDDRHRQFRNYEQEFKDMMTFLDLRNTEQLTMIDLGCGTGATAIFAAPIFKMVYAVDVSKAMLEKAGKKIGEQVRNLRLVQAGFLSYEHQEEPVDLIVTKAAFHHLPDFWKQIALLRMNRMLKTGGLLYIHDVVFQFDPQEYAGRIDAWISGFKKTAGTEFGREIETHIRDEHSTFGWILNGMLERAGFSVEKCRTNDEFLAEYVCRKLCDRKA